MEEKEEREVVKTTYKLTASTNAWIAQRDAKFNGKCQVVMNNGLTLKEAQQALTNLYNLKYESSYTNWGHIRRKNADNTSSFKDGTRSFEYDSRYYRIEVEED